MGHYEDAIGYFEQQLATLEQLSTPTALMDKVCLYKNFSAFMQNDKEISKYVFGFSFFREIISTISSIFDVYYFK